MPTGIRVVGLALALGCLWVGVARACSCVPSLPLQNAEHADVIFIGHLLERETQDLEPGDTYISHPIRHRFLVAEALAGDVGREIVLYSSSDGASCGYDFRDSTVYLVFASHWNGHLSSGLCSGNRSGDDITAVGDEVRGYLDWKRRHPDNGDRRALHTVLTEWKALEAPTARVLRNVVGPLLESPRVEDRVLGTTLLGYLAANDRTMTHLRTALADSAAAEAAASESMARLILRDRRFASGVGELVASEHVHEARAAIRAFTRSWWVAAPWRAAIEARRSNPFLAPDVEVALARIPVEPPR